MVLGVNSLGFPVMLEWEYQTGWGVPWWIIAPLGALWVYCEADVARTVVRIYR